MPSIAASSAATASDEELRAALEQAFCPPLLPALAYLTGDTGILRDHLRPDPLLAGEPDGGLSADQLTEVRALALAVLVRWRDAGCPPPVPASQADLKRMMEFATGVEMPDEYLPLLEEELNATAEDRRAPQWRKADVAPARPFTVAVIGAGMSGLLAAYRLQQAGVAFTILEKNPEVGGTWWENSYPGIRVDNPNHNYSYSFAQRHDWPQHYSSGPVLCDYFRSFADAHDLRRHVRFSTEVVSATWSDADRQWVVRARPAGAAGPEEVVTADAVVSAVGQLNQPLMPDIAGVDAFAGRWFHSARWDHSVDLTGKRVAVIGTGASAAQFVRHVAEQAGHLTIFQRTPPWLAPTPDYEDEVGQGLRWLHANVPSYSEWRRFWIFWTTADGVLPAVKADPAWDTGEGAISAENDAFRVQFTDYLRAEFADRPDLFDKVLPRYPVGAKRIIRDNGVWPRTLKRPNVTLLTDGIAEVTPGGVRTADGAEHAFDVIIYGTGFQASRFLTPMEVTGRGGADLHARWAGDARAYLGITVPGFPNLFLMYGPNTNIVVNGSIIYFSECEARYIVGCIGALLTGGHKALDVRPEVHDAYNERIDAENRQMAWGCSDVSSWYKNANGRVAQNWPFTLLEYWQRTRAPELADFELID